MAPFCFPFLQNSPFAQSDKNREFLWHKSADGFALVGTVFCRSNRKWRTVDMWYGVCAANDERCEI